MSIARLYANSLSASLARETNSEVLAAACADSAGLPVVAGRLTVKAAKRAVEPEEKAAREQRKGKGKAAKEQWSHKERQ